jgi:CrcB protein
MMFRSFLLVGAGGAAGSMARYGVGYMFGRYMPTTFPLGTFSINIVGSLLIGILFGLVGRNNWLQETGMLLLASGFCGGFTTFSTFALDNVALMQKGQSIVYTGFSIVFGLLLCRAGIWLANYV